LRLLGCFSSLQFKSLLQSLNTECAQAIAGNIWVNCKPSGLRKNPPLNFNYLGI